MLPYESVLPEGPAGRRWKVLRAAAYAMLLATAVAPVVQFQYGTARNLRKAEEFQRRQAAGLTAPGEEPPKGHKGAVARWRLAVRQFWEGRNIYLKPSPAGSRDAGIGDDEVLLHPNMPFVVVLLSPFAYLPTATMAMVYNALKLLVLAGAFLLAVRVADDGERRMPDRVAALGLLWALSFIIGDIQHGNTNVFVLGAIALHLWLYRRGRDLAAGTALALAICLKMTPALFVLYWLHQRNWRLLAGTAAALAVCAIVVPAVASVGMCGWDADRGLDHFRTLTATWLDNLILPGLVKGSWYPIHINQSLPAVIGRYFFAEPSQWGNIFWNPDDNPYAAQRQFQWIAVADLPEPVVKMIVRACQAVIVGLTAWAIGWRKLPRDDGRRGLHYALVLLCMMLLNQRTWDHHAAVLLPASLAVWHAIDGGRGGKTASAVALAFVILAGLCVWLTSQTVLVGAMRLAGMDRQSAGHAADVVDAYGPTFAHFLLMFLAAVVLAGGMKKVEPEYPPPGGIDRAPR